MISTHFVSSQATSVRTSIRHYRKHSRIDPSSRCDLELEFAHYRKEVKQSNNDHRQSLIVSWFTLLSRLCISVSELYFHVNCIFCFISVLLHARDKAMAKMEQVVLEIYTC